VNTTHTPPPWIVSHDPDAYSYDDYCIGVPDGKVDQIAVCSKRDAALIAAAPDMYEALKEVLRVADANGIDAHYSRAVYFVRAALAKAGRQ